MTGTTAEQCSNGRAVSPVIGVILMVAISVILAAVVGAFVLEVGDQQETAPSASFESGERVITLGSTLTCKEYSPGCSEPLTGNTSQVYFTHTGGETITASQVELSVNGHRDVWGVVPHYDALSVEDGSISHSTDLGPQPDFRRSLGTNNEVSIASGESWNAIAWDMATSSIDGEGPPDHPMGKNAFQERPVEEHDIWPVNKSNTYAFISVQRSPFAASGGCFEYYKGNTVIEIYEQDSLSPNGNGPSGSHFKDPFQQALGIQIREDDQTNIVWESESGGKTQTLFKYSAQHTATGEKFTTPSGTSFPC